MASPTDEETPSNVKGGSWTTFLKSLASFNGDLSSMTAPPFILSSTSLTEYSAYWAQQPAVFVAPSKENDPAQRALLVLKWFLTTLKHQYSSRNEKLGSEKKPLNPFLGELFLGQWVDEVGTTKLVSEQVSHHPPVTAYCIRNEENGVTLQGYNAQKASFSRQINVKQIGHALLHLKKFDEYYLITLPALHIEGLIMGSPFVELNGNTYIQSSTGFTGKVQYSGRGWLSGKKNSFSASLYRAGKEKEPLYTIEGQWTGEFTIRDGGSKKVVDTWHGKTEKTTPLSIAPLEQQDELETRRAWKRVADAIAKGDMNLTSYEKSKIENHQRELRRREQEQGSEWQRIFFSRTDAHQEFDELASKINEPLEAERTNGVWRFDEHKAQIAQSPYRPGATPPTRQNSLAPSVLAATGADSSKSSRQGSLASPTTN